MKHRAPITPAQKIIWRISELRKLARRLALAGFRAGLHNHDPNRLPSAKRVAERPKNYTVRRRSPDRAVLFDR